MDSLPPIACRCRRTLGTDYIITQYIKRAKEASIGIVEEKDQLANEIKKDTSLTRYERVLKLRELEDEMKIKLSNRLREVLNTMSSTPGGAVMVLDPCCRGYLIDQATLGYNGERYDALDYYVVK